MVTRKLRRRAHCDPTPLSEGKRRKAATLSSLVYVLDDSEVEDDLKSLCKVSLLWCLCVCQQTCALVTRESECTCQEKPSTRY